MKFIAIFLSVSLFPALLAAQSVQDTRRIEEETRDVLGTTEGAPYPQEVPASPEQAKPSPAAAKFALGKPFDRFSLEYGGWVSFRYIDYNEDDNDSSLPDEIDYTIWQDLRLWCKAVLRPVEASREDDIVFYLRIKDLYLNSRPEDTAGGSDNDGPHVDYAYAAFRLASMQAEAGRKYFSVGQGVAYSDVHDGIEAARLWGNLSARILFSHTLPHQDNIDTSVPGYDKDSDRFFYGLQCEYLGIAGQSLYGYALIQRDYSDERPGDPLHNYTYDSEYFGLGARGKLKSTVSYWWEIIGETGKSVIYDTDEKKDIRAWAQVLALSYKPRVYSHPSFYFKYAFGSGDKDRENVTDTFQGNTSGKDANFLYFGYLPTGYALAPQLSNLYFFKTGFVCSPLERIRPFEDLFLAIDYYKYYKDKKTGGIYDTQATEPRKDIGQEVDISLYWQILSDLNFSLQYGHFMPGDAYAAPANDSEDYFSVSATIAF